MEKRILRAVALASASFLLVGCGARSPVDESSSSPNAWQGSNTVDDVFNFLNQARGTGSYTVTYSGENNEFHTDFFTDRYIVLGETMEGYVSLPSYKKNANNELPYRFTFDIDGNVTLGLQASTLRIDASQQIALGDVASLKALNPLQSIASNNLSARRFLLDENTGNVETTGNPAFLSNLGALAHAPDTATTVTSKASFSFLDANTLEVVLTKTTTDAATGQSTSAELPPYEISSVGSTKDPQLDETLSSLSIPSASEDVVSSYFSNFHADKSEVTTQVELIWDDGSGEKESVGTYVVNRKNDAAFQRTLIQNGVTASSFYFSQSGSAAIATVLNSDNTTEQLSVSDSWSSFYTDPTTRFSTTAIEGFRREADGSLVFHGSANQATGFVQSLIQASLTIANNGIPSTVKVSEADGKASSIQVDFSPLTTTAGRSGHYRFTSTSNLSAPDPEAPAPIATDVVDPDGNDPRAVGLRKLSETSRHFVTTETSGAPVGKISYYVDPDSSSVLIKEESGSQTSVHGIKEIVDTSNGQSVTTLRPFNFKEDLTAYANRPDYQQTLKELILTLNPTLLQDRGDHFALKDGIRPNDLGSAFLNGPLGSAIVPSSLKFNHQADGTITSIEYDFSASTDGGRLQGHETLTVKYDQEALAAAQADPVLQPYLAKLPKDNASLPVFVSGWEFNEPAVFGQIESAFTTGLGANAETANSLAQLTPYVAADELKGKWQVSSGANQSQTMYIIAITATIGSLGEVSSYYDLFKESAEDIGWSLLGQLTSGAYVYENPNLNGFYALFMGGAVLDDQGAPTGEYAIEIDYLYNPSGF